MTRAMSLIISVAVMALVVAGGVAQWTEAQDAKPKAATLDKVFPSSNKCKRCHERVFEDGKPLRSPNRFIRRSFGRPWMSI